MFSFENREEALRRLEWEGGWWRAVVDLLTHRSPWRKEGVNAGQSARDELRSSCGRTWLFAWTGFLFQLNEFHLFLESGTTTEREDITGAEEAEDVWTCGEEAEPVRYDAAFYHFHNHSTVLVFVDLIFGDKIWIQFQFQTYRKVIGLDFYISQCTHCSFQVN